ncbi:MAG: aldose epimerase family protein [Anaerolineae bacterium]
MARFSFGKGVHPVTGWSVVTLACSEDGPDAPATVARFTPEVGCNLLGFEVGGTEYLVDIAQDEAQPRILGTPILYPTPNRIRNSLFTFDGRVFTFAPNNGPHYIHGLVREIPWECDDPVVHDDRISVTAHIAFEPGSERFARYPIRNTLELTYTLMPGSLRLDFVVRNEDSSQRLPFGIAIHPYFRVLGERSQVELTVPAQKWMEAIGLIPTGELVDMEQAPADLRQPRSLAELDIDDVFWGMDSSRQPVIRYHSLGKRLTLSADDFYTHCVVYTPANKPFFCVENQSCSTDAPNLYARGLQREAHLAILDPGQSHHSFIRFAIRDL